MLTLPEALAAIQSGIRQASEVEKLELSLACDRILAGDITAVVANPAFDNSAMDGYALRSGDLYGRQTLPLRGESSCGMAPGKLEPGTAMRIFTGAPLPQGADTVEIQENVNADGSQIHFQQKVEKEQNIRRKGEDFTQGQLLYEAGRRLLPMDLGLLATAGIEQVSVYKKPRVLVIATGDELIAPGQILNPGQIYESNKLVTLQQLNRLGMDAVDGGTVGDDPAQLKERLAASTEYDFVITSGGASVGDHDLVKQVFGDIGDVNLWRVKIKPGKPVAFGRIGDKTHFFALPGNPVSSLVTFILFVEPALSYWNHSKFQRFELNAVAVNDFRRRPGRMEFVRARLFTENGRLNARVLQGQGSHMLGTVRHTNGLIRVGEKSEGFTKGETVSAIPLHLSIGTE